MKCLTDVSTYLRKSFAKVVIISETAKFFAFFFVTLHPKHEVVWKSSKQNFPCQPPWYPCVRRIPNPNTPSSVVPMSASRALSTCSPTTVSWQRPRQRRARRCSSTTLLLIRSGTSSTSPATASLSAQRKRWTSSTRFIEWLGLSSIPFAIIFTKADKLTPNKARQAMEAYKKKLLETWEELPPMFLTSSEKKDGRDDVLNYIEQINNSLK